MPSTHLYSNGLRCFYIGLMDSCTSFNSFSRAFLYWCTPRLKFLFRCVHIFNLIFLIESNVPGTECNDCGVVPLEWKWSLLQLFWEKEFGRISKRHSRPWPFGIRGVEWRRPRRDSCSVWLILVNNGAGPLPWPGSAFRVTQRLGLREIYRASRLRSQVPMPTRKLMVFWWLRLTTKEENWMVGENLRTVNRLSKKQDLSIGQYHVHKTRNQSQYTAKHTRKAN